VASHLYLRYAIVLVVLVGHCAFWIHWFNRINATGLKRTTIKRIEKSIIGICFVLPALAIYLDHQSLATWLGIAGVNNLAETSLPPDLIGTWATWLRGLFNLEDAWMTKLLAVIALGYVAWQAPTWFTSRRKLVAAKSHARIIDLKTIDMKAEIGADRLFTHPVFRFMGGLPLNELHWIQSVTEELAISDLPSQLRGLRIGHLSDVHLTGYMASEYYHRAVECLIAQSPDLVVMSGDLIDYEHCLNQVQPLLEPIQPRYGAYFVLGNHDRRLPDVQRLRSMITELGWIDLGHQSRSVEILGQEVYMVGSELPWFDPAHRKMDEASTETFRKTASLRIGVSHSPDQIHWAKKLDLQLLFCGHNHGGQVQLPVIGPLVAPSHFGSRYAGGWFNETPTWMRVSRGLSGTQPLRFRCLPEVSVTRIEKS
jgi:predicted MPP superfamily phosphohydrolase